MLALLLTFTLLTHVLAHPVAEPAPTLAPRQPLIVKREMIDGPLSTIGGPFSDKPQNNKTVVVFPTSNDWFTLNTTNYVLWSWSEGFNPNLRVVLTHNDTKLLRGPLMLDDKVSANMFGTIYNRALEVSAGQGYRIELRDLATPTHVYATSDEFEIKPAGAMPTVPPPYGPQPLPTTLKSSAARDASYVGGALVIGGLLAVVV